MKKFGLCLLMIQTLCVAGCAFFFSEQQLFEQKFFGTQISNEDKLGSVTSVTFTPVLLHPKYIESKISQYANSYALNRSEYLEIRKKYLDERPATVALSKKEKKQIEQDVFDLLGTQIDRDKPVILDLEAIKILKPGKYELDLVHLFKNEPLIYKLEEGKYMIDLIQTFKNVREK